MKFLRHCRCSLSEEKRSIMSKYEPLWNWLKENDRDQYKLSYEELKEIIGFELDHSFLTYKKEAKEYGYEVGKISLKERTVLFHKMR